MAEHTANTPPAALPGLEDPTIGKGRSGRVEAAVRESVEAAKLPALDRGAAALAVELARAVDLGSIRHDPYAVAQAAGPLREQLMRLRLDPAARQDATHDFDAWLESLDDDPATPVPHPPDA
jgi:hypothetical protein